MMFGFGSPEASQSSFNGAVGGILIVVGRCTFGTNFGPKSFQAEKNIYSNYDKCNIAMRVPVMRHLRYFVIDSERLHLSKQSIDALRFSVGKWIIAELI
jgi:hypothetical protein